MKPGGFQWRRMTLRRSDGRVYLSRWGPGARRVGAVFLHRMDAPDPGLDLHDHPWRFVSIVLAGEYVEHRATVREPGNVRVVRRRRWTVKTLRLDECHRVVELPRGRCWTLVICGPVRRKWGFYLADSGRWMVESEYDLTVRVHRRDLYDVDNSRWKTP